MKLDDIKSIKDFTGLVEDVVKENGKYGFEYHIKIKPLFPDQLAMEVEKSTTGCLHEWVRVTQQSNDLQPHVDSVLYQYYVVSKKLNNAAKNLSSVQDVMQAMKGKQYKFKRIALGKEYNNFKAREYIIPVKLLD